MHLFAFWDPEITPLNVFILHGHVVQRTLGWLLRRWLFPV